MDASWLGTDPFNVYFFLNILVLENKLACHFSYCMTKKAPHYDQDSNASVLVGHTSKICCLLMNFFFYINSENTTP